MVRIFTKSFLFILLLLYPIFSSDYKFLATNIENSKDNEKVNINNDYYILGPGDKIFLRIYSNEEFSGLLDILNDGTSTFPLIGSIKISGLTIPQAVNMLREVYKSELLNPELSLEVKDPRPIKVSIIGEIKNPGIYVLDSNSKLPEGDNVAISGIPTLVDAIRKSGGITNQANLTKVKLKRKLPKDLELQTEEYKVANLDLLRLARGGDQYLNPPLFDGDIIIVPKALESAIEENLELLSLNFSPQKIKVNVVGEVTTPGQLVLNSRTTLSQAILSAGGPSKWGANRKM